MVFLVFYGADGHNTDFVVLCQRCGTSKGPIWQGSALSKNGFGSAPLKELKLF